MLGGTGKTIDWEILIELRPPLPWLLAGGLIPENVRQALERVHPDGIDLSSGVERAPRDKDLDKVRKLFENIEIATSGNFSAARKEIERSPATNIDTWSVSKIHIAILS